MTPDSDMIALAHRMADEAGDILRRLFRSNVAVERKSDASPVTLADREVETAMRALIEAQYPQHGIMGEEFGNVRGDAPYQWVLDPIDGTRSFLGGYPLFTTLIALAHQGTPVLGIIDQPVLRERWVGISESVTTFNGKAVAARARKTLDQAVVATTSVDYFTAEQAAKFLQVREQCANSILGGDAYAYAMLVNGHIDIVMDGGMKAHDFCALRPIIEGAGGIISDWVGDLINISTNGCLIAAMQQQLHEKSVELLCG